MFDPGDVHQQGSVLRGDPGVPEGPRVSHQVTHRQVSHHARLQVTIKQWREF